MSDDGDKLSDKYKLRFDFYKHLTTLSLAGGLYVTTLMDKNGLPQTAVTKAAPALFFLAAFNAFGHLFLMAHDLPDEAFYSMPLLLTILIRRAYTASLWVTAILSYACFVLAGLCVL